MPKKSQINTEPSRTLPDFKTYKTTGIKRAGLLVKDHVSETN